MSQMLAMVVNEQQDDLDLNLPRTEFACSNSVSAATGLAPNEVHMANSHGSPDGFRLHWLRGTPEPGP